MQTLEIQATKYTPYVFFDADKHQLKIEGESYPENTAEFYAPIFNWLKDYLSVLGEDKCVLEMEIIYFNSSSSKVLMDIFDLLEDQAKEGKHLQVNWVYDEENESALEYGEEFQEDLQNLPFNLVVK